MSSSGCSTRLHRGTPLSQSPGSGDSPAQPPCTRSLTGWEFLKSLCFQVFRRVHLLVQYVQESVRPPEQREGNFELAQWWLNYLHADKKMFWFPRYSPDPINSSKANSQCAPEYFRRWKICIWKFACEILQICIKIRKERGISSGFSQAQPEADSAR